MAEGAPTLRKAMYAVHHGKMIGEGAYRVVFRTRSGKWVYKVNSTTERVGGNFTEWKTYNRLLNSNILPVGVKLPEMHYLNGGILAAEYIKGRHPEVECYPEYHDEDLCPGKDLCWAEKIKGVPISDLHFENVLITDDGTIYIIDLGFGFTGEGY